MKFVPIIVLFVFLSVSSCSLFEGTANVSVTSNSDKSLSTLSTLDLTGSISNLTLFSPDAFRVEIKTVKIRRSLSDNWVTLYDNSKWGDIVPGVDILPTSAQANIPAGTYQGVLITYNPIWNLTFTWSSYTNFNHTNSDSVTARTLIWITPEVKDDVQKAYPGSAFNVLTSGVKFEKDKNYTLSMKFKTKNMILVWTNGSSQVTGGSVIVPDLTFTAVAR